MEDDVVELLRKKEELLRLLQEAGDGDDDEDDCGEYYSDSYCDNVNDQEDGDVRRTASPSPKRARLDEDIEANGSALSSGDKKCFCPQYFSACF
ncbi:unnamed protein product [Heligmosomoides polygyrus]|uniref:Uncharacterized protein n=1 Tax=Heligmosomoides polygyrus TaxID=6339 RepID=A0A183GF81_HELPZ|nr:unnamed protein product [Heligmosomoides polygyrus]